MSSYVNFTKLCKPQVNIYKDFAICFVYRATLKAHSALSKMCKDVFCRRLLYLHFQIVLIRFSTPSVARQNLTADLVLKIPLFFF